MSIKSTSAKFNFKDAGNPLIIDESVDNLPKKERKKLSQLRRKKRIKVEEKQTRQKEIQCTRDEPMTFQSNTFQNPFIDEVRPDVQELFSSVLAQFLDKRLLDNRVENGGTEMVLNDDDVDNGIYLLSSSSEKITPLDIKLSQNSGRKQKRPIIQKRRHYDGSSSEDEELKLRSVAVSALWVKGKTYI